MSCGEKCEIYSRVCGYFRPISNWNKGKKEEFKDRLKYQVQKGTPTNEETQKINSHTAVY